MDFSELAKKKESLKKTTEIRDSSGARLKCENDITEADITKYQQTVQEANCEEWEIFLRPVTFRTQYVPITIEEAKAFLEVNSAFLEKRNADVDAVDCLNLVALRLQQIIDDTDDWKDRGVFVKTSSRSAKDAAVVQDRLVSCYKEHCRATAKPPYEFNDKIISLLHAATLMLKSSDAASAMSMLTQSERIEQDMRLALTCFEANGKWNENLIVREWTDIDVSLEFRCFIHDRKVCAISQYNYIPYFAHLIEHRDLLQTLIIEFLTAVTLPLLPPTQFQHMVIDVAITGDMVHVLSPDLQHPGRRLWVIEINPFLSSTDGALFSWSHDGSILRGEVPFEFRCCERKPGEGAKTSLMLAWREIIDTVDLDAE